MKVYHNTTNLVGEELTDAQEQATEIQQLVHDVFKQHPEAKTPFEVSVILVKNGFKYPIWSIRARMTTLTKKEYLVKSATADSMGDYGKRNHTWKLSDHPDNDIIYTVKMENR